MQCARVAYGAARFAKMPRPLLDNTRTCSAPRTRHATAFIFAATDAPAVPRRRSRRRSTLFSLLIADTAFPPMLLNAVATLTLLCFLPILLTLPPSPLLSLPPVLPIHARLAPSAIESAARRAHDGAVADSVHHAHQTPIRRLPPPSPTSRRCR